MKRWFLLFALLIPSLAFADTANLQGMNNGGTGSPNGAQSQVCCTIPDAAAANSLWCDFTAAAGKAAPTFDTITARAQATCSTTFPVYEVIDITQSTVSATVTATATVASTAIGAKLTSATPTDEYAIKVTVLGVGCSSTLETELNTVCATMRQ
jgi:hypothetical protein